MSATTTPPAGTPVPAPSLPPIIFTEHVDTNDMWYKIPVGILAAAYIIGGLALIVFGVEVKFLGKMQSAGLLLWGLGIFHFVAGYKEASVQYVLSVSCLGHPALQKSGGFVIAPPGVFKTHVESLEIHEEEYPDEPHNLYWGDGDVVPPGLKLPIRINFADRVPRTNPSTPVSYVVVIDRGKPTEVTITMSDDGIANDDPTHQKSTQVVTPFVRWRIRDKFDFERNIGDPTKARNQLEDMATSFLSECLTKVPLAVAIRNQGEINHAFEELLRTKTARWGIDIVDAKIKGIEISHSLNKDIQDRSRATAQRQTTVTNAEAAKQKTILEAEASEERLTKEGRGVANALQAKLDAETNALKKRAADLGVTGADVLGAEVATNLATGPNNSTVIGTDGFKDLVGVAKAVRDGLGGTPRT